jgi:hypothetical protein
MASDDKMANNVFLERIWEVAVTKFEVLPEMAEEN